MQRTAVFVAAATLLLAAASVHATTTSVDVRLSFIIANAQEFSNEFFLDTGTGLFFRVCLFFSFCFFPAVLTLLRPPPTSNVTVHNSTQSGTLSFRKVEYVSITSVAFGSTFDFFLSVLFTHGASQFS